MTIDLNAVPAEADGLIPDGACVKLRLTIRKGGADGVAKADRGLLRRARTQDGAGLLLDCVFAVAEGPYAGRRFDQSFVVDGGRLDQDGRSIGWQTSASTFRAVIDSAAGLHPEDRSDAANAKRLLRGLVDLDGVTFAARVAIEPSRNPVFPDVNRLERILPVTGPEWSRVMTGDAMRSCDAEGRPPLGRPQPAHALPSTVQADAIDGPPAAGQHRSVARTGPAWLNG